MCDLCACLRSFLQLVGNTSISVTSVEVRYIQLSYKNALDYKKIIVEMIPRNYVCTKKWMIVGFVRWVKETPDSGLL